MAKTNYKTLMFEKDNENIKVWFHKQYYFYLSITELNRIGDFTIENGQLVFEDISEKKLNNKLNILISNGFDNLKFENKPTLYVHKNSGIPLIGTNLFGIVDRNTNWLEIKPVSGCNNNCIYCSVDEGVASKKKQDFLVEKDYLVEEILKLIKYKGQNNIEAHINAQGEPLLYPELTELIKDLSNIPEIDTISIDTNGTLLDEEKVDELIAAGLTRFNVSVNSIDPKIAKMMAGTKFYDVNKIWKIIEYIASKSKIIIAPVLLREYNEKEVKNIILKVKKMNNPNVSLGIQNYLNYKKGRNPITGMSFEDFFKLLAEWEIEFDEKLIGTEIFSTLEKSKKLESPMKKKEIVKIKIVANGKYRNEFIGIAKNRSIICMGNYEIGKSYNLKILRIKHNVFMAI